MYQLAKSLLVPDYRTNRWTDGKPDRQTDRLLAQRKKGVDIHKTDRQTYSHYNIDMAASGDSTPPPPNEH